MSRFICLIVLLALLGAMPLAAQEDTYTVLPGDNLWNLAGGHLYDAKLWEQIYKDNPFLQEPGRRFQKNGIVYVMVRPGEKLVGLEKIGIMATLTPIDRLQLPQPEPKVYHIATTPAWVWWLLAGLAVVGLFLYWFNQRLNRPGATSGPAFVPSGVAATGASPEEAFRTHAVQAANRAGLTIERSRVRVSDVRSGRIWGVLNTLYNNGTSSNHRYNGDRAYEATITYLNGNSVRMYMLDACGNPLIYGGVSQYLPGPEFRFEADPVVQPAVPTPQPAAQPEPAPVAAALEVPTSINQSGEFIHSMDAPAKSNLIFEMRRSKDGKPRMIAFDSDQVEECLIGRDQRIIFRYRDEDPTK